MLWLVILANVAVYGAMAATTGRFSFSARTLFAWGGNLGQVTMHGQYWRLFTATFLHEGPQHILGNMVLLAITGPYCERKLGGFRTLACYVLCGLAASLASAYGHPDVVSIGASGAIAGLLGIMVTLYFTDKGPEINGRWLLQVIGINALYSFAPSVDGLAHLGGFVAGLVLGAVLAALPGPARLPPA